MSHMAVEGDPALKVAQNLTQFAALYAQLPEQAINDSDSPLMPGGTAMVAMGPVANLEAWEHQTSAGSRVGRTYTMPDLEDDEDAWPAFQLLKFWAEKWRREREAEYAGQRLTVASELNFLRGSLDWAWENEDGWDAFTKDVQKAKTRLEEILTAGIRTQYGVKCLTCEGDLVRYSNDPQEPHYCPGTTDGICVLPHKFCPHNRGGLADEWKCRNAACGRVYDVEDYYLAVHHSHVAHADYLTLDDASLRTGVKPGTIKVWATRGKVKRHKAPGAERMTYCVADIEAGLNALVVRESGQG